MIRVRRSGERGHFDHGWLDTHHSFSFGRYHDPRHMGFRALRVINEDRVRPGAGFGMHGHEDMEIVTVVLGGALAHRDSLGNEGVIRPGEVQRMTAGTGIAHSEFNASDVEPVHLYQIWILPDRRGLPPSYEQRALPSGADRGALRPVASPDGRDGSVTIHQDAALHAASLREGDAIDHALGRGRHAWVQVLRGRIDLGGITLEEGDGAAISDEVRVSAAAVADADVLLFDLA